MALRRNMDTTKGYVRDVLDELYPNAQSKTVVVYEGKKYQIRYFVSFIGGYKHWDHQWHVVNDDVE